MRVGLDISIQGRRHPTGVERAQLTLVDALLQLGTEHELQLFGNGPVPAGWAEHPGVTVQSSPQSPPWFWRQVVLPRMVRRAGLQLLHSPVVALSRGVQCPQVATVHELPWVSAAGRLGDRRLRHRWALGHTVRRAARLLCVSQQTADQLTALHPGCAARVAVIPHGVDPLFSAALTQTQPAMRPPLLLAVGRLRRKKNLLRLLEVVAVLPEAQLLVAGPPGDGSDELHRRAGAADLVGRVRFAGFLSDAELLDAYVTARCVVFPSLFEGFGLPVLEAMAAGTPVVAARQGAVAEAVGEAALLMDGSDVQSMAQSISQVLEDGAFADALAARGREHSASRSAAEQARSVVALWEQLT
ncbi:MAG: glycosyltransferase involved in cell wall biosynthesis [Pseudohongiellaceae bacterium]|jgi:glycosyltransferase involved in cell wall biosynthesis